MISVYGNNSIQTSVGKYTRSCCLYRSDSSLQGKLIRFSPAVYLPSEINNRTSLFYFQAIYTSGLVELDNLGYYNGRAWIRIIDNYNFEICFEFIAGSTSQGWGQQVLNSDLLDSGGSGFVGMSIIVDRETYSCFNPITVNNQCELSHSFKDINGNDINGFIAGQDLTIELNSQTVNNNNFEVLFYNQAITNFAPIIPALGLSYANISAGASVVNDYNGDPLPNGCIIDGNGFQTQGGQTTGKIVISGSCLQSSATYGLRVIYKTGGQWKSCLITIRPNSSGPSLSFEASCLVTDCFGATSQGNAQGASPCIPLDFLFTLDEASINNSLSQNGLTGSFADYFKVKRIFCANAQGATNGVNLIDSSINDNELSTQGFINNGSLDKWIVACWELDIDGIICYLYKYLNIKYNGSIIDQEGLIVDEAGKQVPVICAGNGLYTLDSSDKMFVSINGNNFIDFDNPLDSSDLIEGSEVCIKKVSQGDVIESNCECPECPTIPYRLIVAQGANPNEREVIAEVNGGTTTLTETIGGATNTGTNSVLITVSALQTFFQFEITHIDDDGCESFIQLSTSLAGLDNFSSNGNLINITSEIPNCDCPDEVEECPNSVNLDISCDGDQININKIDNYSNPVDSEEFLCSTDGVNYLPCPTIITGEERVFILVNVTFSDGCDPIHIEEEITCNMPLECPTSSMVTEGVDENCLLQLSFTDNFNGLTPIQDILYVGSQQFSPASAYSPIQLSGVGSIEVERIVSFNNGCPDLIITREVEYDCTDAVGLCDLDVNITPGEGILTASVSGCSGTPSYQWFLEVNGVETQISNTNSVALGASGNYIVEVTCDDCTPIRRNYTYIASQSIEFPDCFDVNIKNDCLTVEFKEEKEPPTAGTPNNIAK